MSPMGTQTSIAKAIGGSPQSDGKALLLKTITILLNTEKSRDPHPLR